MARKPIDKTVDMDKLVSLAQGFSGADIAALVNAAAMSAIKEHIAVNRSDRTKDKNELEYTDESQAQKRKVPLNITMKHFESAIKKIKPNIVVKAAKT